MKTTVMILTMAMLGGHAYAAQPSDDAMHDTTTMATADTPHDCLNVADETREEMTMPKTDEFALTLYDHGADWFTIEGEGFERLQGASIEGSGDEMLEVAAAIEQRTDARHKRVQLRWDQTAEIAYLSSPRNSISESPVSLARLKPLPEIIRRIVAESRARPPETPLGDWTDDEA